MTKDLEAALASARRDIGRTLAGARAELAEVVARKERLEALIAEAERLEAPSGPAPTSRILTLHEAVAQVLSEHENRWMTARELADIVNERKLYRKKDGTEVEVNQVHARTTNYKKLFEKDASRIRLRNGSSDTSRVDPS